MGIISQLYTSRLSLLAHRSQGITEHGRTQAAGMGIKHLGLGLRVPGLLMTGEQPRDN